MKIEVGSGENFIDVLFPKMARFWVALEGALDGKGLATVKSDSKAFLIPFGILIVNFDKSRNGRGRGMGECILGIATEKLVIESGGEGKEESLDGLINACRVRLGKSTKKGCSARRSIATIPRTTSTVILDMVLPMRT